MRDYIKLNGASSETLNLWVDTPPVPPMARQRYTSWVNAADEGGTTADDTFEDIKLSFDLYSFLDEDYDNTAVYQYFTNVQTLEFSRHSGFYYKVKQVSLDSSGKYDGARIRYRASFVLSPFRYGVDNPEISISSGDTVTNNGSRYARPVIRLTGSGEAKVTVNGEAFTFLELSGKAVIDCVRMVAYDPDNGDNLLPNTTGKFPFLAVGNNTITYTNISSLDLTKNERWY